VTIAVSAYGAPTAVSHTFPSAGVEDMRRQGAVSVHGHAEEVVFLGPEKLSEEDRKLLREQSKGLKALQ
jgi:hypothetical protein